MQKIDSRWRCVKCEIFRITLSQFTHVHFRTFALSHFITSLFSLSVCLSDACFMTKGNNLGKCVTGVSRDNPVRQTIPYIDHSDRKTVFSQVVFNTKLLQSQIISSSYIRSFFTSRKKL